MPHDDVSFRIRFFCIIGFYYLYQFGGMVLTLTRIPLCLIVLLRDIYDSQYQLI